MRTSSFYFGVAAGTVLDHSGLPLFLLAGAAAAPELEASLAIVVVAAGLGAFAGDVVAYVVGRMIDRSTILAGWLGRRFRRPIELALDKTRDAPTTALLLYRYVPAIGKYAPLAAGIVRRPAASTLALCAFGSLIYAVVFGAVGWLLQPVLVEEIRERRGIWGPIVALTAIAILVLASRGRGEKAPSTTSGGERL